MDLFSAQDCHSRMGGGQPLPERLRPQSFTEFVGQTSALGENSPLRRQIEEKAEVPNLILWGPPGTGKTTFSRLLAKYVNAQFLEVSAVDTGVKILKNIGEESRFRRLGHRQKTLLFVDEIHRLNKAQQDVLLPYMERGDFVLIGATTENPGYELNNSLLSRSRLVVFAPLSAGELKRISMRAFELLELNSLEVLSEEALKVLTESADGDARRFITWIEQLVEAFQLPRSDSNWSFPLNEKSVWMVCSQSLVRHDRAGESHYDSISAFIKSIRGSDPDAGLYYLARMLEGGEDPVYIARRLIVLASEDVGNADPRALGIAVSGLQAVEAVGLPEAGINLAQVVTYLACAPKSNRSYLGFRKAQSFVRKTGSLPIPKSLRSENNFAVKQLGFGLGYAYSHEGPTGWVDQKFLPEEAIDQSFYELGSRGFEKNMQQYLDWMKGKSKP